jgi:hypothetical protein
MFTELCCAGTIAPLVLGCSIRQPHWTATDGITSAWSCRARHPDSIGRSLSPWGCAKEYGPMALVVRSLEAWQPGSG